MKLQDIKTYPEQMCSVWWDCDARARCEPGWAAGWWDWLAVGAASCCCSRPSQARVATRCRKLRSLRKRAANAAIGLTH